MRIHARLAIAALLLQPLIRLAALTQPPPDAAAVIQHIDAVAYDRYDNVLGFTVTEHYSVIRGKDGASPAAEMTVKTTYKRGVGKSYTILSQSGSEAIHRFGLRPLLENEKRINDPANVEKSWFTSANYEMQVRPSDTRKIDGRDCIAVSMHPRRKAPNMIEGTLWVDSNDNALVEMDGIASRSPSAFAGTTKMMRHYVNVNGYAMATRSRAESNSFFFGRTVVTIEYSDYQIELRSPRASR
jgi:hypothetical protein